MFVLFSTHRVSCWCLISPIGSRLIILQCGWRILIKSVSECYSHLTPMRVAICTHVITV